MVWDHGGQVCAFGHCHDGGVRKFDGIATVNHFLGQDEGVQVAAFHGVLGHFDACAVSQFIEPIWYLFMTPPTA